ncbi:ROK family protein [Plantibacter flavus]|uniref:ROK family protein n=1 Tax=Plantibacter flavus TaxID=150123 RepID=UPI003F153F88
MRVGLDIGGTKTDAVAVTDDGALLHRLRLVTGSGPEAVVDTAVEAVRRLSTALAVPITSFASVGVGIPGLIVPGTGRVAHAVNLDVEELELGSILESRLGVPVTVENDVKAAALGAWQLLDGSGTMAYLNLGTGVAAGIVRDGVLWRGSSGIAGEVGHLSVDPLGDRCSCGQRGCVETMAAGGAVGTAWGGTAALPVLELFDHADAGDARAIALRKRLGHGAAAAIRILTLTVDADDIVLGGGLTALGERLLVVIREALAESATGSRFVASLQLEQRVRLVPSGSPVAAVGAALVGRGESSHG